MTREKKIKILKAIRNGVPADIALRFTDWAFILYKDGETLYYNGKTITDQELAYMKKLSDYPPIIYENASDNFHFDAFGNSVRIDSTPQPGVSGTA